MKGETLMKSISRFFLLLMFSLLFNLNPSLSQWIHTNGSFGGSAFCLAGSGSNLYAGYSYGGVFRSTNNGAIWRALNFNQRTIARSLAASGANLFVGTDGGVSRSTDNGANWTGGFGSLTSIKALAVSGLNVFAGSFGAGVFLSTDNGVNWDSVSSGLSNRYIQALALNNANIFAGSSGGGVFLSSNNGQTWVHRDTGLTDMNIQALTVDGTYLFAGTLNGGVFRSSNNGSSWSRVSSGLPTGVASTFTFVDTTLFVGIQSILAGGAFRSTNYGLSWERVSFVSQHIYALATVGTSLFAGTYFEGVFRSTNRGSSWNPVNTGLTRERINSLGVIDNSIYAGTPGNGIFRSDNDGLSWLSRNFGLTNTYVHAFGTIGTNLFAGTNGGAYRSTNGASWTPTALTNPVIAFTAIGESLFAGTQPAVFLSTNVGNNWNQVSVGLTIETVLALAANSSTLAVGTNDGVFVNGVHGLDNAYVYALAATGSNIFAGTYIGGVFVYLSTDNGASWVPRSTGLTSLPKSFAVSGANIFLGTFGGGVFLSRNNGTSWTAVNSGLPANASALSLAIKGTYLFAGTDSAGVWRRPLSEMTSVERLSTDLPTHFSLGQNYPNPFNPVTKIRFSIPASVQDIISLRIYDMLGREVSTLMNETLKAGTYEATFDATTVSSGTYFYKLHAGSFVSTKKMLLIK